MSRPAKSSELYWVYSGYVSVDCHDSSEGPIHTLRSFSTPAEVAEFRAEFEESVHDECDHVCFEVIRGRPVSVVPSERVVEWKVEEGN